MGLDETQDRRIEPVSQEKMDRYLELESMWIDAMFNEHWPKFFSWFARLQNKKIKRGVTPGFFSRLAIAIVARLSGFTVNRNQHLKMLTGNGFRKGHEKIVVDHVTVTIKKHGNEVAKRDFKLSVY